MSVLDAKKLLYIGRVSRGALHDQNNSYPLDEYLKRIRMVYFVTRCLIYMGAFGIFMILSTFTENPFLLYGVLILSYLGLTYAHFQLSMRFTPDDVLIHLNQNLEKNAQTN